MDTGLVWKTSQYSTLDSSCQMAGIFMHTVQSRWQSHGALEKPYFGLFTFLMFIRCVNLDFKVFQKRGFKLFFCEFVFIFVQTLQPSDKEPGIPDMVEHNMKTNIKTNSGVDF